MLEPDTIEQELLYRLQRGLPLEPRPFAVLGRELGATEAETIRFVEALFDSGRARRLGAVFDARRLGYRSVLCAVSVPDTARMETLAQELAGHPGITHCYERGWPDALPADAPGAPRGRPAPNLWFTLAVLRDAFDDALSAVCRAAAPDPLLALPALTRFKIDVVFDPAGLDRGERFPGAAAAPGADRPHEEEPAPLSEEDRRLVRRLEGHLPPVPEFYAGAAADLGLSVDALLARLRDWQTRGLVRRVGLITRHRQLGYRANAMCVWHAPAAALAAAGRALAARPEVTHCYERLAHETFPYNLYAMIHTGTWADTLALYQELTRQAGLEDGRLLGSLREFKKSSMHYFAETAEPEAAS